MLNLIPVVRKLIQQIECMAFDISQIWDFGCFHFRSLYPTLHIVQDVFSLSGYVQHVKDFLEGLTFHCTDQFKNSIS